MSNLLNRMAARAIRTASIAQPVVPALFTPSAGLTQNSAELGGADLHSDVEVAMPVSTLAHASTVRHESVHDPALQDAARLGHSQTGRVREVVHSNPLSPAAGTLPRAEAALHPASENPAHSQRSARVAEPNIDTNGDRRATRDSSIATQTIPAKLPNAAQSRVNPLLPAQNSNAVRHDRMQGSASERPVVRVTIGRIDVRAQFSAAASSAPATRTRPATLTMDEYLKQRNEGKR